MFRGLFKGRRVVKLPFLSKTCWNNDVNICYHDVIVIFFVSRCCVSLVNFSYWSKFHVNIITGSGITSIFFHKGLTRNPEIGNSPVWVLRNAEDWGVLGIPNLEQIFLMKYYWMLENAKITAFTFCELLRENQEGSKITTRYPD